MVVAIETQQIPAPPVSAIKHSSAPNSGETPCFHRAACANCTFVGVVRLWLLCMRGWWICHASAVTKYVNKKNAGADTLFIRHHRLSPSMPLSIHT